MSGFSLVRPRSRRRVVLAALTSAATLVAVALGASASAVSAQHTRLVGQDPVNWTPHALDGTAYKVLAIGNRVYVGGTFTRVRPYNSNTATAQPRLFAFNAATGALDTAFRPVVDGAVRALVAAPDGQSLYLAGDFTNVNGVRSRGVERINAATGASWAGFTVPDIAGGVDDMKLSGNRLVIGGRFQTVGGATRRALAALNATTGARDDFLNVNVDVARVTTTGVTSAIKVTGLDITPDGTRLVVIGNFSRVAGQLREQIAVVNLTGTAATLSPWATVRYREQCLATFPTYMRGVDISADGSWFAVVTSGGGRTGALCDTAARWDFGTATSGKQPTWVNYTGRDTLLSVSVAGAAVYVGGHQRWLDNPQGHNDAGPGAVPAEGVGAINPVTGKALAWNPGKDRGVGTEDIYATAAGLWIASDTDTVHGEFHGRIAFFPLP
ncbi:hypothetical protein QEZ54_29580 [Catellatospora sp. KI3]|uniref:hypothetical protein n=1 Tax=Catellatospora sp. KI3 TaxID=3041620 RepID=UPI002482FBA5|nr:hypothetical protein [Catellatospora sp. KI3]MDI1465129.1 hypothetical protein [Catellatospora sp. KI3]